MEMEPERCAIRIIAENRKGVLRDIATVVAEHEANIVMINQEVFDSGPFCGMAELYFEYDFNEGGSRELTDRRSLSDPFNTGCTGLPAIRSYLRIAGHHHRWRGAGGTGGARCSKRGRPP